jgi:hypothetical protein
MTPTLPVAQPPWTTVVDPIPSGPGPIDPGAQAAYHLLTEADYLRVSLIPILLATILSILVQIFVSNLNLMLPFRALSRADGATAEDSLCLSRGGFIGLLRSFRFIFVGGDSLPFLNSMLLVFSAILVPLSSETIKLEVQYNICPQLVCPSGLRNSIAPSRTAETVLVIMAGLLVGITLFRWRSGVASDPWSTAAMASILPMRSDIRDSLVALPAHIDGSHIPTSQISQAIKGKRFRLAYGVGDKGTEYGLSSMAIPEDIGAVRHTSRKPRKKSSTNKTRSIPDMSPQRQELILRGFFLVLLCGLLALILYYENTILDSAFEAFMDSQKFGVRFLFAAIGVIITDFWDYLFSREFLDSLTSWLAYNLLTAG